MSDRYETPSWDDDPEELGAGGTVAGDTVPGDTVSGDMASGDMVSGDAEPRPADEDLDASSENVFDGWPLADSDVAGDEPVGEVEAPEHDGAQEPTDPPPLADHVSDSSEHAPGELT